MDEDLELKAMRLVMDALAPLDPNVALRVVRWAYERSKEKMSSSTSTSPSIWPSLDDASSGSAESGKKQYSDLPTLYHAADPSTEPERALVVGYWFQVLEGNDGFYSYSINSRLKDMSYQIGNITRAFESLTSEVPKLVIQVSKGETQQARKRLRLTTDGIRKVETMLQKKAQASI